MLFEEEHASLLKAWVVKRIENTSDADSDVLADYVIALLKHDGSQEDVRRLCEQEIPDFLTEEPKAFLDDVFQALNFKSYLPGGAQPPAKQPADATHMQPAIANASAQGRSRKRALDDQPEFSTANEWAYEQGNSHRQYKQARRGGGRGMDRGYPAAAAMPQFDLNNPMETIMQMQAMGIPFPPMPGFPPQDSTGRNQRNQPRRRGRCRDFDAKGYCSRGNTCMYDHGNELGNMSFSAQKGEEYDPNDPAIRMPMDPNQSTFFPFPPTANRGGRGGSRGRGNGHREGRKGGARAPFSAAGPVHDRTKSTIVVENIPEESFSEEKVRDFFSQFGNITEVTMQPYKHLAIVKYDAWAAANDAYRSPKVIFDNRFVKIFWHKDEKVPNTARNETEGFASNGNPGSEAAEAEPEVNMEDFQKKQEEAQKLHLEREAKKGELERKRQEIEQQQKALLAKHNEETERLRARLSKRDGDGDDSAGASSTDALRAQVAALEQEAKILGIDPNAAAEDAGATHLRGGFRGGRGYRGRGAYPPRGRGSFRGQGARHAAYAQFSIDNRPRKLAVKGADFTSADKDETLRRFLLNLGEFESVETSPSVTHVSFRDRKSAEKFYFSLNGQELQGVEGKLELTWVSTPLPPVSVEQQPGRATATTTTEDAMAEVEINNTTSHEDSAQVEVPDRHADMDYEVGDDDAWGDNIH
ncbi:hypothetical protein RJ55_08018 [Drechmeria coniospora]|nr:hypothetical protein RJ55_08018 [Drechmeria coniospora]